MTDDREYHEIDRETDPRTGYVTRWLECTHCGLIARKDRMALLGKDKVIEIYACECTERGEDPA